MRVVILAVALVALPLQRGSAEEPPSFAAQTAAAQPAEPALASVTPGPELTLAQAVRRAQERNLTLQATRLEIDKARAQLHQAWGALLPFVGGQVGYTYNDHADRVDIAGSIGDALSSILPPGVTLPEMEPMVVRRQEELRGSVQASVPLVNVQAWMGVSAARLGVEAAALTVESAQEQLLFGVAQAYWSAVVSRELVGVQAQQVIAATRHVEVARARQAAGDALRIDVVRAETEVEKARQDLLAAHLALDNARDALATLTASDELPLPAPPPALTPPAAGEGDLAQQIAQRPEVRAARAVVAASDRLLTASWMQLLPTLSLAGQYSYLFTEPPELASQDRSRWAALLTLTVPIYTEVRYADLDAKRAALRQAELRAAEVATNAELEARKARRDYLTSLATVDTAERQAQLTREALTLAETAYANGAGTSLDVTDAQRASRTAEINAAAQRLKSQMALLGLLKATGQKAGSLAGNGS
jgi:outer membrane protein